MPCRRASLTLLSFVVFVVHASGLGGCSAPSDGGDVASPPEPVVPRESIQLSSELRGWTARVTNRGRDVEDSATGYTECAPIAELEGGHVCASSSSAFMNRALLRASLFAEGNFGAVRGKVASTSDPAYRYGLVDAGGHDLRSEHLGAFWTGVERACAELGATYCATREERLLFEVYILPLLAQGRPFALIAFPSDDGGAAIAHEIFHAQYFLQAPYRETTDRFWDERVSATDKESVRNTLSAVYDVTDDVLVRNEFMAYVLQPGGELHLLATFVPDYRTTLRDALTRAGTPPLQVQ